MSTQLQKPRFRKLETLNHHHNRGKMIKLDLRSEAFKKLIFKCQSVENLEMHMNQLIEQQKLLKRYCNALPVSIFLTS